MSKNTKTEDQKSKTKNHFVWLLLALLIVFVYFFGLTIPLLGPDEPRYSQIAREMFERGDFVTPKLGGFDWFEKPALLYWLQIFSYKIFGVTEFAARFGSAIFGLLTIFSLWILGRNLTNRRKDEKTQNDLEFGIWNLEFANWLALIAASSIGLIVFSRGASFDIILTFPITASLVGFFIFDLTYSRKVAQPQPSQNSLFTFHFSLFTFHFFIGIALIAKGLIGIIFPIAIVGFYYLLLWKLPNKTFILSLFWGTILSLLIASLWYVPMYQANGWKFIDEFFIQHHFQRYLSNKYQHPQPFWFFFLVLPLMTIPWLPFFLASIWDFFKSSKFKVNSSKSKDQNSDKISTQHSALSTFAFAWMLVPLVFFSISGSKLPGYILPALPGALILTALYVDKFVQKSVNRKYALQILAFLMFIIVILLLQFAAPKYAAQDSVKGLVAAANKDGFTSEKIVNLYTVSHNLEFYAPSRLVRNNDGTQKRYDDFSVLVNDIKNTADGKILVLVPQKDLAKLLTENPSVETKLLSDNGEEAIILVKVK
ncbi:MAG: glycosyltransferase family 39 protein [Acidobacteriota bacterium]